LLKKEAPPPEMAARLAIIAKRASDCEQSAADAERENDRWKTCLLMKSKIGEKFHGVIQGFSQKAAFIRLERPFVEVGAPLGALGGEFTVDEYKTKASGLNGQVELPLGAKTLVEITSVDENLHRVSAWILEVWIEAPNGKTTTFTPTIVGNASFKDIDANIAEPPRVRARGRKAAARGKSEGERLSDRKKSGAKYGASRTKPPKGSVRRRSGR